MRSEDDVLQFQQFRVNRRLVFKNGVDTLLNCARLTAQRNPRLVYLVIGKGPDLDAVRARVAQLGLERNYYFYKENMDRNGIINLPR